MVIWKKKFESRYCFFHIRVLISRFCISKFLKRSFNPRSYMLEMNKIQ